MVKALAIGAPTPQEQETGTLVHGRMAKCMALALISMPLVISTLVNFKMESGAEVALCSGEPRANFGAIGTWEVGKMIR